MGIEANKASSGNVLLQAHNAAVAALFDETCGLFSRMTHGLNALTWKLEIRWLCPIPLCETLAFRTQVIDDSGVDGDDETGMCVMKVETHLTTITGEELAVACATMAMPYPSKPQPQSPP